MPVGETDLCIVLGNALENAIEACAGTVGPRFVSAEAGVMNDRLLIRIEDSCSGSLDLRDGRYFSTKNRKNRGMGIQSIRKVVDAYGGYLKADHDGRFTLVGALPCRVNN